MIKVSRWKALLVLALAMGMLTACATQPAAPPAEPAAPAAAPASSAPAQTQAQPAPAPAQPAPAPQKTPEELAAEFYQGKVVKIVVGYSTGGGYDLYARTLANHIGRHIPGNPRVVVENMPGAGSLVAANWLATAAPKDGTVIATFARGLPQEQLVGNPDVQFKSRELNWIGSMNEEVSVCVARSDAAVKTFQDVFNTELIVGGTGSGADTDVFPNFLNTVLGTKFKVISGYPGGNDINLALERGEVDGRCGWSWSSVVSTRGHWLQEKYVNVLVQMALNKHPDMPDVPLVLEFAPDEESRQVMELLYVRQAMGRPYAAPQDVPAERVAALRKAFEATLKDPQFLAEAEKAQMEIVPVFGEQLQQMVIRMFNASPELIERFKVAMDS